jgi:hypothetical protein
MSYRKAMGILMKEMDFLGMTLKEVLIFIERNPYAVSPRTIEAYNTYQENKVMMLGEAAL